jgi:hypothetical protein
MFEPVKNAGEWNRLKRLGGGQRGQAISTPYVQVISKDGYLCRPKGPRLNVNPVKEGTYGWSYGPLGLSSYADVEYSGFRPLKRKFNSWPDGRKGVRG